ncbi:MAG TPA: toll/interleukin-1 receptor domain-containing protein [Blastocatellia bacterium]|nr:toll/interleukin-1 receptor domain-containing protein [Blastocatellia bacterium]
MAKPVPENVIFFGHASRDKGVVQEFANHLFDESELSANNYKLFFTDTDKLENLVQGGAETWKEILEHLRKTSYFLAFLSQGFFESQWCLPELALFQELQQNSTLPDAVLLLIDDDAHFAAKDCALTQSRLVLPSTKDGLKRIVASLAKLRIPHKSSIDYAKFGKAVDNAILLRDQCKKGDFFELAKRHFTTQRTSDNPVSFFVERDEYEQTAINMGRDARERLLWTVFQSPLLVRDAYDEPNKLMPYDRAFETFSGCRERIRLIIFQSEDEAKAYATTDENWHNEELKKHGIIYTLSKSIMEDRREAFHESVNRGGGTLLFTVAERLTKCSRSSSPPAYSSDSFLEFAYGGQGTEMLLMETGFSSPFSLKHGSGTARKFAPAYGHVTFYRELVKHAQERIAQVPPYNLFYGHLDELWHIADSVFQLNRDSSIFVPWGNIGRLYT